MEHKNNALQKDMFEAVKKSVKDNDTEPVKKLIKAGMDPNMRNDEGFTPLHTMVMLLNKSGHVACVKALVDMGADVNAQDRFGCTPLHDASSYNKNPAGVLALLEAGADMNIRDQQGWTPLFASLTNHVSPEVVEILLESVDMEANSKRKKLGVDARKSVLEKMLADKQVDVNAKNFYSRSVLGCIRNFPPSHHPWFIKALLDAGLKLDVDHEYKGTPLHFVAANSRNPETCKVLLAAGAGVNAKEAHKGNTPLHNAVEFGSPDVVRALLDAGADLKARNKRGRTPVFGFAFNQDSEGDEILQILLDAGAEINIKDEFGATPLHWAAEFNNPNGIQALIKKGADVHALDEDSGTPLHGAARTNEDHAVVWKLLDNGADINARNHIGNTPLHEAADGTRSPTVIRELITRGADIRAKNHKGYTAWDYAQENISLMGTSSILMLKVGEASPVASFGNNPGWVAAGEDTPALPPIPDP